MKKWFYLIVIFTISLIVLYSCVQKPCDDISCLNKGVKLFDTNKCSCECLTSTRGNNCEINLVDSLEGAYLETDSCSLISSNKNIVRIDSSYFEVSNLANITCSSGSYLVHFSVIDTIVKMDSQYICPSSSNYLIFGNGQVDYINKKINIKYYLSYFVGISNQIDTCHVFYDKL